MNMIASTICLLLMVSAPPQIKEEKNAPPADTEEIRRVIGKGDGIFWGHYLSQYGTAAFPAYEEILRDPKSPLHQIAGVLAILGHVKATREQFLDLALPFLAHKDAGVRECAAGLMEYIGSPAECSILIALLSDPDPERIVAPVAASSIAKIGGERELIAMDAWLRVAAARGEREALLDYVKMRRDELDKRLKLAPMPREVKR